MKKFEQLDSDSKIVFLLSLNDLVMGNISESQGFEVARNSIDNCWEWLKTKKISAFDLYLQLENMDEVDVLSYMSLEKDADKIKYWSCIANALAYTIREAYNFENERYLPQTIESVDYDTIEDFINNFNNIYNKPTLPCDLVKHILKINNSDILDKIKEAKLFLTHNI